MVRNRSRWILIVLVLILLIASLVFGLLTYWPRLFLPHGVGPDQEQSPAWMVSRTWVSERHGGGSGHGGLALSTGWGPGAGGER